GSAAEHLPGAVLDRADDQRVQHDDVGHREERDDPAPDLGADRRAALGDLEETVDRAGALGGRGGVHRGHKDDVPTARDQFAFENTRPTATKQGTVTLTTDAAAEYGVEVLETGISASRSPR